MSLTTIAFLLMIGVACVLALRWPLFGAMAYMYVYLVDPPSQWWGSSLPFQRWSLLTAIVLAIGILLNLPRLSRTRPRFGVTDVQLLLFLAILWFSLTTGLPPNEYSWQYLDKMTKLTIFLFMWRWVVATPRQLHAIVWCIVLCGGWMAWQAYNAPESSFRQGRLNAVGGGDFLGANDLGIHMGATLALAGALLVRFRKLWQRGAVSVGMALMLNTIIQTRSRSAFLGIAAGFVVALVYTPKRFRLPLVGAACLGFVGFLFLADPDFWVRMRTLNDPERETSAHQRLVIWRASVPMFLQHPMGVGIGNFGYAVERYVRAGEDRDSHNTYITCYTELGIQGSIVFAWILIHTWRMLTRASRVAKQIGADELLLYAFAMRVGLVIYLIGGISIKRIYAEGFWWFVILPAILLHVAMRAQREQQAFLAAQRGPSPAQPEPAAPEPLVLPGRARTF